MEIATNPLTYGVNFSSVYKENRVSLDAVNEVRNWLMENKLPKYTDEQIALFLIACENDMKVTKHAFKVYHELRCKYSIMFQNRNIDDPIVKKNNEDLVFAVFPKRTPENYVVIYHAIYNTTPSCYHMDIGMRLLTMAIDSTLIGPSPPSGIFVIFDLNGISLAHLARIKFSLLQPFFKYVQEGVPIQIRALHVINTPWFFEQIFAIVKPFLKADLLKMMKTYSPKQTKEITERVLPKEYLPSDFGGILQPLSEMRQDLEVKFREMLPLFQADEEQRKDLY